MRIVSLDFGLKRIGMAITDENQIIASPLPALMAARQTEETITRLLAILADYTIEELVIGNPLHMNGETSFLSDEVKHFVDALKKRLPCPIILWDERLSSLEADRILREGKLNRKKRSKQVDSIAAVLILQSYLATKAPSF